MVILWRQEDRGRREPIHSQSDRSQSENVSAVHGQPLFYSPPIDGKATEDGNQSFLWRAKPPNRER